MFRYHPWRVVAMCAGVALTAIDLIGALTGLWQRDAPFYLMAAGAVIAITLGLLDPVGRYAWRQGNYPAAILCFLMIPVCAYQVVTTSLESSAGAQDAKLRQIEDHNYAIALAKQQRAEAVQERDKAREAQAAAEAKAAAEKHRGGCKALCEGFQAEAKVEKEKAEAAQARIDALDKKLEELGPPIEDPLIDRLSRWFWFLDRSTIVALHPLVLPMIAPLLGALMIDVSLWGVWESAPKAGSRTPRRGRKPPPKSKRGRKPKMPPTVTEEQAAKLLQFRRR